METATSDILHSMPLKLCYLVGFSGLWPASSVACEKYGSSCCGRKIRWCLFWSKAAIWFGIFPNWYHHDPFPNHKELWHGRISQIGIYEGNIATYLLCLNLKLVQSSSMIWDIPQLSHHHVNYDMTTIVLWFKNM